MVQTRLEQANGYEINDKPFTEALMLRASHYQDESIKKTKKMAGRIGLVKKDKTLKEFIASCAATIAHEITIESIKNINMSAAFIPQNPVPKYASKVLAVKQ